MAKSNGARPKSRSRPSGETATRGEGRSLDTSPVGKARSFCALPPTPVRVFGPNVTPDRAALIRVLDTKWVNGTVLRYYFFDQQSDGEFVFFNDGSRHWQTWTGDEAQKDVVRKGFKAWQDLGIGVEFKEVATRGEAEIRIGFMEGDGAWSYIGREILNVGTSQRTMNFGWDLAGDAREIDTAIHEIGHTLGFPHEHQNPNAGIVWDEEAVYAALAKPPNSWSRDTTFHNIIRKLEPQTIRGSNWDPDSVMHYPFEKGLIKEPARYRNGLTPAGGLSEWDRTWIKQFYPPLNPQQDAELKPFESIRLSIGPGEQRNFVIQPTATRKYNIQTFGISDTVVVLFEDINGALRYKTGDDDSGEDRNASLLVKLFQGRRYVLRIRLYYSDSPGDTSIMMW